MQASAPVLDTPARVLLLGDNERGHLFQLAGRPVTRGRQKVRFTEPAMRTLYADWEAAAQSCVAQLRMEAARCPEDPRLAELVGELSTRDAQFAKWWAEHRLAARTVGTETLDHPVVGELVLEWDMLTAHTDPDQHLTVWTAAPGSPTQERLRILASWAAEQKLPASSSLA